MNNERTPGDWETYIPGIEEMGSQDIPIIARTKSGNPRYIGRVYGEGTFSTDRAERNANAEFIVKACNDYGKMRELLDRAAEVLQDMEAETGSDMNNSLAMEIWDFIQKP